MVTQPTPFWIAKRHGQDWRSNNILTVIDWLTSFVDSTDWSRRIEKVSQTFEVGRQAWAAGERRPLFDNKDGIAWYIFQANAYATAREDWFEPEAFRIVPVFRRLGHLLPELKMVSGIADRISKLMIDGKAQPDDGLFELLVAGAYKCRSWKTVEFVPEQHGIAKSHDIMVSAGRRRWAVECKRVNRSGYEATEYDHGLRIAKYLHDLCRARNCSLIVEVAYQVQLSEITDTYLAEKAEAFLSNPRRSTWDDSLSRGRVRPIDWYLARSVMEHDDVFFGSSRMVELLIGRYEPHLDHSVVGDWIPAPQHPFHATAMSQASIVSWLSRSTEAAKRKARHFKSLVARAEEQLPNDCPGVIHVGYEARSGNSVDDLRHYLNTAEMMSFSPTDSQLRWVYGNYLSPEHTNAPNESEAISETTATYKIGSHRAVSPLDGHLLFSDGQGRPGTHW